MTMARRYLYARIAAFLVLGPSSAWFLTALQQGYLALLPQVIWSDQRLDMLLVAATPSAGAFCVFGRLDGMSKVGCARHASKK